jgi:holliday junction DNA helicase RuvA
MIANIRGKVVSKQEDRIYIDAGSFVYEVFMPGSVLARLEEYITDGSIYLTVYYYFQADQRRFFPVLIGFLSDLEKEFFEKILKVSGIGPKAALKVLNEPISQIASAIDRGDVDYLKKLPGVGLQRAKNIIAFLQGKVGKFALIKDKSGEKKTDTQDKKQEIVREAQQIMVQLQYRKREAQEMIERALRANPDIGSSEELLNYIYMQNPAGK